MKDLLSRSITTSISLVVLMGLFIFAFNPWICYLVAIFAATLAAIAIWEYEQLVKAKGRYLMFYALAPLSVAIVLSFFVGPQWPLIKNIPLLTIFLSCWILFPLHFQQKEGALVDLAVSLFGLFYIAVPIGMILGILYLPEGGDGRFWLGFLLAVTKVTDIGAYFAGSLWGKRKLAPMISPGKTVEGAIFGWICAVGMSVCFYFLGEWISPGILRFSTSLWLGAILGIVSQLGDLSESLLKRDAGKKDSNRLPGIGGVLDLVDSLLFNAPILYIYLL